MCKEMCLSYWNTPQCISATAAQKKGKTRTNIVMWWNKPVTKRALKTMRPQIQANTSRDKKTNVMWKIGIQITDWWLLRCSATHLFSGCEVIRFVVVCGLLRRIQHSILLSSPPPLSERAWRSVEVQPWHHTSHHSTSETRMFGQRVLRLLICTTQDGKKEAEEEVEVEEEGETHQVLVLQSLSSSAESLSCHYILDHMW